MVIHDIRTEPIAHGARLSATIHSGKQPQGNLHLWFEFTSAAPIRIHSRGDAFFAAGLPIAMQLGEALSIEGPVSPFLLRNAGVVSDIFKAWAPGARKIDVNCAIQEPAVPGEGEACLFSCGVDSFYSLLKRPRSFSHLITVHGFDIPARNEALFGQLKDSVSRVASSVGAAPVWVKTNIREFSDVFMLWGMYHGAAAASVALGLQGNIAHCVIASSYSYANLAPWGTHPLLDPLWSAESLAIVHDGCEATRTEKIAAISANPIAMDTLRVCWSDPNHYNCGKCEKCLRTMLALHICGALGCCSTLPGALTPRQLAEIPIPSERVAAFLVEARASLGSEGIDLEYASALDQALERWSRSEWLRRAEANDESEGGRPEMARLQEEIARLTLSNEELAAEVQAIRRSKTWRFGASLGRSAGTVFGRFRGLSPEK